MASIKVSVIIPVYNAKKYLKKCLDSVMDQIYKDYEVILVDDGSSDESEKMCDSYALKNKNVHVIHKKNEGLICARITGLEKANGELIAFVDADDWVEPYFLERLVGTMESVDADMVISGYVLEKDGLSTEKINKIPVGIYKEEQLEKEFFSKMLWYEGDYQFGVWPYMWNKIFRREKLKDCYVNINTKIYDGEDVAVVYPYLLRSKVVVENGDCLYHYRIHKNSMTFCKGADFYQNVCQLYLYLKKVFQQTNFYEIMRPQLDQYLRMMIRIGTPDNLMEKEWYYFPFSEIPKGAKIVLYGGGRVGKAYFRQITGTDYCNVVLWVDRNYKELRKKGMQVYCPDKILSFEFDYVVVANADIYIRKKIEQYLMDLGINKEQIVIEKEKQYYD